MASIHHLKVSEDINALWKSHSINLFMPIFSHTWQALGTYLAVMAWRGAKKYLNDVNSLALQMNTSKGSKEEKLGHSYYVVMWQWLSWKGILFIG